MVFTPIQAPISTEIIPMGTIFQIIDLACLNSSGSDWCVGLLEWMFLEWIL